MKLIEKKDRDKKFLKIWRSISSHNVDFKSISKVLANAMKNLLGNHISSDQNAYVIN